jgi:hypothetical protein
MYKCLVLHVADTNLAAEGKAGEVVSVGGAAWTAALATIRDYSGVLSSQIEDVLKVYMTAATTAEVDALLAQRKISRDSFEKLVKLAIANKCATAREIPAVTTAGATVSYVPTAADTAALVGSALSRQLVGRQGISTQGIRWEQTPTGPAGTVVPEGSAPPTVAPAAGNKNMALIGAAALAALLLMRR